MQHYLFCGLMVASCAVIGCSGATKNNEISVAPNVHGQTQKKMHAKVSKIEVIVTFHEGITIKTATSKIQSIGLSVGTVYRTISQNTHQPMMTVHSPYDYVETRQLIQTLQEVRSVSLNNVYTIEPDPTKPQ